MITMFFFRKTPIFSAENWQKSQKIVFITSTPGSNPADVDRFFACRVKKIIFRKVLCGRSQRRIVICSLSVRQLIIRCQKCFHSPSDRGSGVDTSNTLRACKSGQLHTYIQIPVFHQNYLLIVTLYVHWLAQASSVIVIQPPILVNYKSQLAFLNRSPLF
jgi:hypothetical protein